MNSHNYLNKTIDLSLIKAKDLKLFKYVTNYLNKNNLEVILYDKKGHFEPRRYRSIDLIVINKYNDWEEDLRFHFLRDFEKVPFIYEEENKDKINDKIPYIIIKTFKPKTEIDIYLELKNPIVDTYFDMIKKKNY